VAELRLEDLAKRLPPEKRPPTGDPAVVPETAETKARKDAEDAAVRANTKALDIPVVTDQDEHLDPTVPVVPDDTPNPVIHFVSDGFTAWGRVWYQGQEVEVTPEKYADTLDRKGKTWMSQTESDQIDSWGKVMWREGPWPHARLDATGNPKSTEDRRPRPPMMPATR
jgi:hypothetical protein